MFPKGQTQAVQGDVHALVGLQNKISPLASLSRGDMEDSQNIEHAFYVSSL